MLKDASEGLRFALFVRDRPWPRLASGFLAEQQLDEEASFFAAQHHSMLSQARCAVSRYERYYSEFSHLMVSPDPYDTVSGDVIAALIRSASSAAASARGEADAGCSGTALLAGLAFAHTLARAPFPPDLLGERRVLTAASSPRPRKPPASAHMPLAALCLLEDQALAEHWNAARNYSSPWPTVNPFTVQMARTFVVMALLSLRGVDGLRASVCSGVSARPILQCSTRKAAATGKSRRGSAPSVMFQMFIPERGVLPGVELWLPQWLDSVRGRPYIFRAFEAHRVGRPDMASSWLDSCMCKAHMIIAWEFLLSPLYSSAQLKAMHLSLHGPRHLLAEVAKQFGPSHFSALDRNELGRWSGSESSSDFGRAKVSGMADVYAREGPAHDSELRVRLKVLSRLSDFLASRQWSAVVPAQQGVAVSFSFLSQPEALA